MWSFLDNNDLEQKLFQEAKKNKWAFSREPQPGEITVLEALVESYKTYKGKK